MRVDELRTFTIPASWLRIAGTMDQRRLEALRKVVDEKKIDPNDLDAVKQEWSRLREKDVRSKPFAVRDGKSSYR